MFTFNKNLIYVGTADGILSSNIIQLEGKDKITAVDFKNVVKNILQVPLIVEDVLCTIQSFFLVFGEGPKSCVIDFI